MNRRSLLKGFVAGAAGLLVPTGVVDAAEEGRRWWSMGAMPGRDDGWMETGSFDMGMPPMLYAPPMPPPMRYAIRGGWFPVDGSGVEHVKRISLGESLTFWESHEWVDYVVTEKVPGGVLLARNDV